MGLSTGENSVASKRRRVLFCGDVGIPESEALKTAASREKEAMGAHLTALMEAAASIDADSLPPQSNKNPRQQQQPQNVFSSSYCSNSMGLSLLKHAATHESVATVGADPTLHHAASLDTLLQGTGYGGKSVSILKVASGKHHSLLLLSTGQAVMLSSDASEHALVVTLGAADDAAGVQDIAAGTSHFVICTDLGTVFTFGWSNGFGQLGDGTVWQVDESAVVAAGGSVPLLTDPKKLSNFGLSVGSRPDQPLIISVAAGAEHTVLLTASRAAVYTCGRGHRGQLGTCRRVELQTTPLNIKCLFGCDFASIAAAGHHTLLLLDTGKLIAFGENTTGAAGIGGSQCALDPEEVSFITEDSVEQEQQQKSTTSVKVVAAGGRRPLDQFATRSIKAPYGSIESVQYPRRVFRLPQEPSETAVRVTSVATNATMTIVSTESQQLFSAGLRVRPDPVKQRPDALGPLGRPILHRQDSNAFGLMSLNRCSTAAHGGWQVIIGSGFSAFLDIATGVVRVHGTIRGVSSADGSTKTTTHSFSSMDWKHTKSFQTPNDDSIVLNVGTKRKVVAAAAVKNGLLVVVEDDD